MKSIIAWLSLKPSPEAASDGMLHTLRRITPSAPTPVKLLPPRGKPVLIQGLLQNESDDGIGVHVDARPELEVDRWLKIMFRDRQAMADVRHVTPGADGGFIVGLRIRRESALSSLRVRGQKRRR